LGSGLCGGIHGDAGKTAWPAEEAGAKNFAVRSKKRSGSNRIVIESEAGKYGVTKQFQRPGG
jgi:hypothetical protein